MANAAKAPADRYDVCVTREYTTQDNETRTAWTRVGVAFRWKNGSDGFKLIIEPGISVSGELTLVPPKARDNS